MATRITWDLRKRRADELLDRNPSASQVLRFYRHLLVLQQEISRSLAPHASSEARDRVSLLEALDVDVAVRWLPSLLEIVQKRGPEKLANDAAHIGAARETEQRQMLLSFLDGERSGPYGPSAFFARVLFQPHMEFLASQMTLPSQYSGTFCPLCGSRPQLAVLRPEGDGGKRHLACSLCLSEWEYRRIVCPVCDEVDHTKLPRYSPEEPTAVRVEACDTCKAYQKSFDMTADGLMVPEVDEMATVALDLWATDHGYHKIQVNLLGF